MFLRIQNSDRKIHRMKKNVEKWKRAKVRKDCKNEKLRLKKGKVRTIEIKA